MKGEINAKMVLGVNFAASQEKEIYPFQGGGGWGPASKKL
jgi:hypothetical protein